MLRVFFVTIICLYNIFLLYSFDYPQPVADEEITDDVSTYFAETLKDAYSTGIIFSRPDTVKTAADGKILIRISENAMFPSTLGNAIVIKHEDDVVSVSGNLEEVSLSDRANRLRNGQNIGKSGHSAWQVDESGAIFITYDLKNRNAFNPLILLPRLETPRLPPIYSLTLIDGRGTEYSLDTRRTVPSGNYALYRSRSSAGSLTHKSTVLVNGEEAGSVDFNMLSQNKNVLSAFSTNYFPFSIAYPSADKQLLGSVSLKPGRNVISITLTDIAENTRTATQVVEAY